MGAQPSRRRRGAAALGSRIDPIAARELEGAEEKATILLAMSRQYPFFARGYFKVDSKQVTLEEARALATRYPVFRIETSTPRRPQGGAAQSRTQG